MRPLSVSQMLAVWERGLEMIPLERALALLEAAYPGSDRDTLGALSIGQRNACLLTLREWAFGSEITAWSPCPHCRQSLEFTFQVGDLRQSAADSEAKEVSCSLAGYDLLLRPVNSLDLIPCSGLDMTSIQRSVFASCLLSARAGDADIAHDQIPEGVAMAALESVVSADSHADLFIEASCSHCAQRFRETFDIVSFFWTEIDAWARRILCEVHVLARAYGWRESDILALNPFRRQLYLEMANA